jgi:hypothetical protein
MVMVMVQVLALMLEVVPLNTSRAVTLLQMAVVAVPVRCHLISYTTCMQSPNPESNFNNLLNISGTLVVTARFQHSTKEHQWARMGTARSLAKHLRTTIIEARRVRGTPLSNSSNRYYASSPWVSRLSKVLKARSGTVPRSLSLVPL